MKKQDWIVSCAVVAGIGMSLGAAVNSPLEAQNGAGATPSSLASGAKSSASTEARIARIARGIEPIESVKGEPPVSLDIEKLMKLYNVPGLSVALIEDYEIAWTQSYGVTEPGGTTPVTAKTLFQAGSISKPVAAAGMLALVEKGKLSLDENVNEKLQTWKVPENEFTREQKVTLRRLASHSAGLTVHGFPGYDVNEKVPTLEQIFNGEKPANTAAIRVDFVPGTEERYSGGGVTIEQQLMMDVSGKQFPVLMKETVLDKIGMSDSSYEQPLPPARAAMTAGGVYADGKPVHGKWHVYPEMAAAGLWTTPTDLAKFAIEIARSKQGKSNKVLAQKTVQEMLTPQSKDFGIGFAVSRERPGEFGHDGADEGFQLGMLAKLKGLDAMLAKYDELKNSDDPKTRPDERVLNGIGYDYLRSGAKDDAIRAFQKNVKEYPRSSNVYDSLGEAYAAAGRKELAIENYEKSVKLDAKNQNGIDRLKKLKDQK